MDMASLRIQGNGNEKGVCAGSTERVVMVWCATARGRARKGSVCPGSGCNMWFVSSRLVVLSFCPCVATAARTTASNTPGKFRNRKHATQPPQAFDRREMTRGLGSRVNPQWHFKNCARAFERRW